MKELKEYVISIPDFPKKGIIFRDVTGVLEDPDGYRAAVDALAEKLEGVEFDMRAGVEARGFLFASTLAYNMHKGVLLIRKKGIYVFKRALYPFLFILEQILLIFCFVICLSVFFKLFFCLRELLFAFLDGKLAVADLPVGFSDLACEGLFRVFQIFAAALQL